LDLNLQRALARLVVVETRRLGVAERLGQLLAQQERRVGCLASLRTTRPLSVVGACSVMRSLLQQVLGLPRVSLLIPNISFDSRVDWFIADSAPPPVTTGTSNPPYSVYSEKDPGANSTLQYQSITALPQYRGSSFEVRPAVQWMFSFSIVFLVSLQELRTQDYQQGRKTAGGFGQSATFGAVQPSGGILGAAQQNSSQSTNPLFGGSAFNAGNTNQPATGSVFGSGGAFGQTNTGFGAPTAFGQPQQQQQSSFGTFGQPQQNQQQPATGGGIFGSGGGAFGQKSTFGTSFGTGGGTFGQPQQQQQTSGLFGQPQQAQSGNAFSGGGTFGEQTCISSLGPTY
jgi:hypothetical protein